MTHKSSEILPTSIPKQLLLPLPPGLEWLFQAWEKTVRRKTDVQKYALSYERLRDGGLTDNDLRRLTKERSIMATEESIDPQLEMRATDQDDALTLSPLARFHLTPAGVKSLRQLQIDNGQRPRGRLGNPYWREEGKVKVLCYAGFVAKRFLVPSPMQMQILDLFAKNNWRRCIESPAPDKDTQSAKDRLNDEIRRLMHGMDQSVMSFHGDGTGMGIRWFTPLWI